jgi:ELWxxDGT repeat protein
MNPHAENGMTTSRVTRGLALSLVLRCILALLLYRGAAVADDSAAAQTPEPLRCGAPLARHLGAGAVDQYAVTVAPGAAVTVNASDSSGSIGLIKLRTSAADETCSGTLELTQPGSAIVEVSDCLGTATGDYTITASVVSQDPSNCGLPLPCGATLRVLTLDVAGEVDAHRFTGTTGDQVSVTAVDIGGTIGFVRLRVFDPDGVLVSEADVCRSSSKALTLQKSGTYTVLASACGLPKTGEYGIAFAGPQCPTGPDITYLGIARPDSTVLPPTTYDKTGRPVYTVAGGSGFFVVAEGRPGTDNQRLGLQAFMYDPADPGILPDLQVLVSRPLGNGSAAVCDKTPPNPGGVPASYPLAYDGTQAVADAINDFGCRVNDGTGQAVGVPNSSEACTLFPDGQYHFVDSTTTAQFCAPIAQPWSFLRGATVVRARLRDAAGAVGAEREMLVRIGEDPRAMLLKDIAPGPRASNPAHLLSPRSGSMYFTADDARSGVELWHSVGSDSGTMLVSDIRLGSAGSLPDDFTEGRTAALFFTADDGTYGRELWSAFGGSAGIVKDINRGEAPSNPSWLTRVSSTLFFTADDGSNGRELWTSNNSTGGTVMVRDINPGPTGASPHDLTNVSDADLFFAANDGSDGDELWKSDGTETGTVLVADIRPGPDGSSPAHMANVDGTLFFTADDGTRGVELWKSDGTPAGTVLVRDIHPGTAGSNPTNLTAINRTLYFTADDGFRGVELWRSDGTEIGTFLVSDIRPGAEGSAPVNLTVVNGMLFFTADDGTHGVELWRSNGSGVGTVLVADINPGADGSWVSSLANVNGTLIFAATDGTHGVEPWKSNGTPDGTRMIQDIAADELSSQPDSFTVVSNKLLFAADDKIVGRELWALPMSSLATPCQGDCNGDQHVTIDELVTAMNIVLGTQPLEACSAYDVNGDGAVTVDELIGAMSFALNGCPAL